MLIPRLIHRQLFKELTYLFLVSLGALLTLILIGRMLQLRELFLSQGLGILEIGELFLYLSPFFLLLLVPIACMLSVFLTFLRMSSDWELMALKAGGLSLYQLLWAPLVFCLLCTGFNFWISFQGLSWGMDNFKSTILEHARTRTQLMLQPGVFNRDFPGLTLFAEKVDPATKDLELVYVRDESKPEMPITIVAPTGQTVTDKEKGQLLFLLRDGHIYRQEKDTLHVLGFSRYIVKLDLSRLVKGVRLDQNKPKEMSWSRLQSLKNDPALKDESSNHYRKVLVEIQKRLTLPLACVVLGLFAMPFAFIFQGLKQYLGLIMALICFLIYYSFLSLGFSLGETGLLNPGIALWTPNIAFLTLAIIGIRMAAREKYPHIMDWVSHLKLKFAKK